MDSRIVERFERENGELADRLRALRGHHVWFMPNPGNAGDSLIAVATVQLLDHYGVPFELLPHAEAAGALQGQTVLLGGGGNLVPLYSGMATVIDRLLLGGNTVILLPHSVGGNESLLARLPSTMTVFCREVQSWRHIQRHAPDVDVQLGHDLALYLDVAQLEATVDQAAAADSFRSILKSGTSLTPEALAGRVVSCMRHGAERTTVPSGPNYDVSVVFRTGVTPGHAELGAWMMLEFARRVAEITTNRLHIGVAAALVGTPVVLYDNSYGKVSGVYMNSIRGRFPLVSFAGAMRSHLVFAAR